MSFRCDNCNKAQEPGTKPVKVVTETRDKSYPGGGQGWEIVREEELCSTCASRS